MSGAWKRILAGDATVTWRAGHVGSLTLVRMRWRPQAVAFVMLFAWFDTALAATPFPWPPLSGGLSGDFTPLLIPGAPTVHSTLSFRGAQGNAGERIADVLVEGPGVRAKGEVKLTAMGEGRWRITEGEIDAALWLEVLAPKFFPILEGATAEGKIAITGEGTIHEGKFAGKATTELRDATLRHAGQGWSLIGVSLTNRMAALPGFGTDGTCKLTFREASFSNITASDGVIEFSVDDKDVVHVERATCAVLDGRIEITPFTFPLKEVIVQSDVRFEGIELGQIAAFLPPVLARARGKISGRMSLRWSAAEGVQPGSGRLQIDAGAEASIQLRPQPGFFTSRIPPRLKLLPAGLGVLSSMLSIANPAYEPLRSIEMGETSLELRSLDIGLQPEGDEAGRTAHIVLQARPQHRRDVESVRFEINVKGPLADVLRIGIEHRLKIQPR